MTNWKCEDCGKVYGSNPTKCTKCSNTIFQQTDEKPSSLVERIKSFFG